MPPSLKKEDEEKVVAIASSLTFWCFSMHIQAKEGICSLYEVKKNMSHCCSKIGSMRIFVEDVGLNCVCCSRSRVYGTVATRKVRFSPKDQKLLVGANCILEALAYLQCGST